jgi:hypothetical protein
MDEKTQAAESPDYIEAEVRRRVREVKDEQEIQRQVAAALSGQDKPRNVALAPERPPEVGDVVNYYSKQNAQKRVKVGPDGKAMIGPDGKPLLEPYPTIPWAAMVIKANGGLVDLTVFHPEGPTFREVNVPYSAQNARGTWQTRPVK